jgi:excisionase family DNA binding protein
VGIPGANNAGTLAEPACDRNTTGPKLDIAWIRWGNWAAQVKNPRDPKNSAARASLTTGQAASHCQVSTPTLKSWIREGRLRAFKTPGGHARIAVDEFQRFLKRHRMPMYPIPPAPAVVLVVDDEAQVVDLLVEFLTHHPRGFKIETASDGYEALIKLGSLRPALLILDAMMPKLDGIDVCRHLKSNPETRAIRILGVTGYPAAAPQLLAAGADAVLAKPLALGEIESQVERLLESTGG